MRPVSAAFLRTVRGSHAMTARARVVAPGQTGTDPDGVEIPILAGDVRMDAAADVRSTVDLLTAGTGMWPSRDNPLLAPYGNELFVERGVLSGGGAIEWVSLGYHRIDTPDQDQAPDGPIRVAASDRMSSIVDSQLPAPRQYTAAQTFGAVVDDLVLDVFPTATIEWDDDSDARPIGRAVLAEQDRYATLRELVDSLGKICFWDHRGIPVIKNPPDSITPVYDITHGRDGVLVSASRDLTRVGVVNGIVAIGEAGDDLAPVRALVVDADPDSPTFWGGPFGKVPKFFHSPLITSTGQADTVARALLGRELGLPYRVQFGTVANPALEPIDPIRVTFSDRYGWEAHVVETLTMPLVAESPMTGATRVRKIVLTEPG